MALIENINTYKKMVIEVDQPINDIVTAVQEDANSRYLDIQLFKDGVSFDLTNTKVRIYMIKPDGKHVFHDGEIKDPVSGRCQFLLTTQILAACGEAEVQIKVFSMEETQIVSTQVFKMYITKTLLTNEDIESSNEYGSLVILFQNVYEALQMIKAMLDNFGEPGETAAGISADTFWKMLEAVYNVNADALKNASVSEVLERIGTYEDLYTKPTLFGHQNKLERDIGFVKSAEGKLYAAKMQEEGAKFIPNQQSKNYGVTANSERTMHIGVDETYVYFSNDTILYKINRENMQEVTHKDMGLRILEFTVSPNAIIFISGNGDDKYYRISKEDFSILGSSAEEGAKNEFDAQGILDAGEYFFYVRRTMSNSDGGIVGKMRKSDMARVGSYNIKTNHETLCYDGTYVYYPDYAEKLMKINADNMQLVKEADSSGGMDLNGTNEKMFIVGEILYVIYENKLFSFDKELNPLDNKQFTTAIGTQTGFYGSYSHDGTYLYYVGNDNCLVKLGIEDAVTYAKSEQIASKYCKCFVDGNDVFVLGTPNAIIYKFDKNALSISNIIGFMEV